MFRGGGRVNNIGQAGCGGRVNNIGWAGGGRLNNMAAVPGQILLPMKCPRSIYNDAMDHASQF